VTWLKPQYLIVDPDLMTVAALVTFCYTARVAWTTVPLHSFQLIKYLFQLISALTVARNSKKTITLISA
jgi:hypothetical protein